MPSLSRSGHQDRRGFETVMKIDLVLMPLSLLVLILYDWKVGLALLMITAVAFIVMEAASAPPENGPLNFLRFVKVQVNRRPVMVCLGDSLTQGTVSSSFTPDVPRVLASKLGMEPPRLSAIFAEPVWLVNCGQNSATSHSILKEKLNGALMCRPDYVLIMIGTNDVRAMYKASWAKQTVKINSLPQTPTLENFESNLRGIIDGIQQSSILTTIGVCTLPPMGEDLSSKANEWVRKANIVIEKTVNSFNEKCSVVPVYEHFENVLEKKPNKKGGLSVDNFFLVACWMNTMYYLLPGVLSWNALSKPFGHILLSDGLHLNERGKDTVVNTVVEWLLANNITKAISVKSL